MKIYTSLHNRLTNQHLAIVEIIAKIPADRIIISPAVGKWNIHDNLAHLAKYQIIFIERINKIVKEDMPHFDRYKAADDPDFEAFQKWSDSDLLTCLHEQRLKLNKLVFSLSATDLEKIGVHKKYGALNILQWLEFFVLHEAHHLFTIFQLANDTELQ